MWKRSIFCTSRYPLPFWLWVMLWCCTGLSNTPSYINVASQRSGPIIKVEMLVMPIWNASSIISACNRMYSPRGNTSLFGTRMSALAKSFSSLAMRTSTSRIMVINSSSVARSSVASFSESDFASASTRSVISVTFDRKLSFANNRSYSLRGSRMDGAILPGPYHEILSK